MDDFGAAARRRLLLLRLQRSGALSSCLLGDLGAGVDGFVGRFGSLCVKI